MTSTKMSVIDDQIFHKIFLYLDPESLFQCATVSKDFHRFSEFVWNSLEPESKSEYQMFLRGRPRVRSDSITKQIELEIWTVEKFQLLPLPKDQYGKFNNNAAYLVLNKRESERNAWKLRWDLYYWFGRNTTVDVMGSAAIHAVDLDEKLGGRTIHYREVEGYESPRFLSLFREPIQIIEQTSCSSFRKVDRTFIPRLLHVKGNRNVRVKYVPVSVESLNDGDVFILDIGPIIYVWIGSTSNAQERSMGLDIAYKIKEDERKGNSIVLVLDGCSIIPESTFWNYLGGYGPIKRGDQVISDIEYERTVQYQLFKISSDEEGHPVISLEDSLIEKGGLDSNFCYMLDTDSEIYTWVGKNSTKQSRRDSAIMAESYLSKVGKPSWTPIVRIPEGGETSLFKGKFKVWPEKTTEPVAEYLNSNVAHVEQEKIDVRELHKPIEKSVEEQVDDGSGTIEIWRIENFRPVPVEKEKYGQFYSGDSYVVLYSYNVDDKPAWIIYYWQGSTSTTDERGASALIAKEMDDARGGEPVQVRVVQNKEPNHFLLLFKGKMIVHAGGCDSGFSVRNNSDNWKDKDVALYHIRGTNELNTRAVQVPEESLSLNSTDVFLLLTPETMFLWKGRGSNTNERRYGEHISAILQGNRTFVPLEEGSEPQSFWDALGGKEEYALEGYLYDQPREPRLFKCSNATGQFKVEEILSYSQDDLDENDIFILDTHNEVYVWVGDQSNVTEKKMAFETAIEYVSTAQDGRSKDTPIIKVVAGHEPKLFTCHFHGWNPYKFVEKRASRWRDKRKFFVSDVRKVIKTFSHKETKYSLIVLQIKTPEGVDPAKKEEWLRDKDFEEAFGITKEEFQQLPEKQKINLKKQLHLY